MFIKEARQASEIMAQVINNWMNTAAQNQRNADYYQGLLVECGEIIGKESYISDDGSIQEDVLCAKIPDLVTAMVEGKK